MELTSPPQPIFIAAQQGWDWGSQYGYVSMGSDGAYYDGWQWVPSGEQADDGGTHQAAPGQELAASGSREPGVEDDQWHGGEPEAGAELQQPQLPGRGARRSRGGRGSRRAKGGGKGEKGEKGDAEGGQRTPFMYYSGAFVGEWSDSLGHTVIVKQSSDRRGPLTAKLTRGTKEQILSLRRAPETGVWACGNAVLDVWTSTPTCLVWSSHDGRRSTWRRQDEDGNGEDGDKVTAPPDLLPWLLVTAAGNGPAEKGGKGSSPVSSEEQEEAVRQDGARVSAVLDVRQVLGADRAAQEILSYLLTDHDLLRREDEDPIVPAIDSPLWERLPDVPRRNALHRLADFRSGQSGGCPVTPGALDVSEVHVGRHRFPVAPTDIQALRRRFSGGPADAPRCTAAMAHVLALYRTLETPLNPDWQRSSLQLGWDPVERKRAGIGYELFASPFNASVRNGQFGSRWPHAECLFGSAGSYPSVIDVFPEGAIVGVNPPFSDAYLDHVMAKSLERMLVRFKKVHLFVPVRDAPWRPMLSQLKGASFVRQFWDATALKARPLGSPVMYWEGSELAGSA